MTMSVHCLRIQSESCVLIYCRIGPRTSINESNRIQAYPDAGYVVHTDLDHARHIATFAASVDIDTVHLYYAAWKH